MAAQQENLLTMYVTIRVPSADKSWKSEQGGKKVKWQRWVQGLFLLLFLAVMVSGRVQIWMMVFLGSMVGTLLLSRFYCGWICPINTVTTLTDNLFRKKRIRRKPVPSWAKKPVVRFGALVVFLLVLMTMLRTGRRLPLLPVLTLVGVLLSLRYVSAFWHRYLCPYGTLLSLPGTWARKKWQVTTESCTGCGACVRICPAEAVAVEAENGKAVINASQCLACTACARICPPEAINYSAL